MVLDLPASRSDLNVWLDLKSKVLDQVPKSKKILNLTFAIKYALSSLSREYFSAVEEGERGGGQRK